MGLFDKLFGRKSQQANDSERIQRVDASGQQIVVTIAQWRTSILPHTIRTQWEDPKLLYATTVGALSSGFFSEVLAAAAHLQEIDPSDSTYACVHAIALTQTGKLAEAEELLLSYLTRYGADGYVLTNLSKVYTARGNRAKAADVLWNSLETDPNQANAVDIYAAQAYERGGRAQQLAAWERIASLPRSWRAQLLLARAALEDGKPELAMKCYPQVLALAGPDVPADVLLQISGDLGSRGRLSEMVALVGPHFSAANHGVAVGSNLIRAYMGLGQNARARSILDQLREVGRTDWSAEIDQLAVETRADGTPSR